MPITSSHIAHTIGAVENLGITIPCRVVVYITGVPNPTKGTLIHIDSDDDYDYVTGLTVQDDDGLILIPTDRIVAVAFPTTKEA